MVLNYLLGPILNNAPNPPYPPNDKPIGGSYIPALAFNAAALLSLFALSFYSLGIWKVDLSNRKTRVDILALGVIMASGLLIFTTAIALFPFVVALLYLIATNIE